MCREYIFYFSCYCGHMQRFRKHVGLANVDPPLVCLAHKTCYDGCLQKKVSRMFFYFIFKIKTCMHSSIIAMETERSPILEGGRE